MREFGNRQTDTTLILQPNGATTALGAPSVLVRTGAAHTAILPLLPDTGPSLWSATAPAGRDTSPATIETHSRTNDTLNS